MSIQFLGMIGHRLFRNDCPGGADLTATISFALRKPMKPPGLIVCWSATGPINPTAFW